MKSKPTIRQYDRSIAYTHEAMTGLNSAFITPVKVTPVMSKNIMATIEPEYAAANPTGCNLLTNRLCIIGFMMEKHLSRHKPQWIQVVADTTAWFKIAIDWQMAILSTKYPLKLPTTAIR